MRFLLLALTAYQVNIGKNVSYNPWIIFSIVVLSMLNVALPLLSMKLKFQQRQEVHDRLAREYCVIKTEFLTEKISLETSVERFSEIRRKPNERIIRETP